MKYICKLTRFTRMCVTSHAQPLINAKYKIPSNKLLVNKIVNNTDEPIGLIILITSWLTINIATFPPRSNAHHSFVQRLYQGGQKWNHLIRLLLHDLCD
jgi:hypothetical protein